MGHPNVENLTPFEFQPLFVANEDGRPTLTPIIKATFDLSEEGHVALSQEQAAVKFEGEPHGEPGKSSYRLEPETAFIKPGTDIVLVGHGHAPQVGSVWVDVDLQVGDIRKVVRVYGDRFVTGTVTYALSNPAPFERIPLVYERAFGGWDRTHDDERYHTFDPTNPVGVGFRGKHTVIREGDPLPNLEDPHDPLRSATTACAAAGFGFVGPDWMPRATRAGTYDDAWTAQRAPLLPKDFSRWFFNAGSTGLVSPTYLLGNEAVHLRGATPEGYLAFWMPGVAPPKCLVSSRFGVDTVVQTNLDTVIVDGDTKRLTLLWRGIMTLREGPLDVRSMKVHSDHIPESLRKLEIESSAI